MYLTSDIYALLKGERLEFIHKVGHTLDSNKICGEGSGGPRDGNLLRSTTTNVDQLLGDVGLISDSKLPNDQVT